MSAATTENPSLSLPTDSDGPESTSPPSGSSPNDTPQDPPAVPRENGDGDGTEAETDTDTRTETATAAATAAALVAASTPVEGEKKGRGRPKGSKNKPRDGAGEKPTEITASERNNSGKQWGDRAKEKPAAVVKALTTEEKYNAINEKVLDVSPALLAPLMAMVGNPLQAMVAMTGIDLANSQFTIFVKYRKPDGTIGSKRMDTDGITAFIMPMTDLVTILGPEVMSHPAIAPAMALGGMTITLGMAARERNKQLAKMSKEERAMQPETIAITAILPPGIGAE